MPSSSRITLQPQKSSYPAGTYSGSFTTRWKSGAAQKSGNYPNVSGNPGVCSQWPGSWQSGTATFQVDIKKYCKVTTKRDIEFGTQPFLDKPIETVGQIDVQCSEGTNYDVAISDGDSKLSNGQRAMKCAERGKCGDNLILYDLYHDAAHAIPWKSGWGNKDNILTADSAENQPLSVYAVVPPQAAKPAGSYKDRLVVTVRIVAK